MSAPIRLIGYWRDPADADDPYRHPAAFVDLGWDGEEREQVARYLRAGTRMTSYLGWSWCRFRCGIGDDEMGDSEFSDGVWIWPGGLAHYVVEHSVRLPGEFLEHVRHHPEGPEPARSTEEEGETMPLDLSYWIEWCNENADPASGYEQLERREAEAARRAAERERRDLGRFAHAGTCSVPGCERSALKVSGRCPWHHLDLEPPDSLL